jgi:hypothetical protein
MGTTKSAEEVKNEQISIMGFELGSLYNLLYNETIWLHYKWVEFNELYGAGKTRLKIMNETAPFFFLIIQKTLWENILLGIARITDPPKTMNKKNITIQTIPEFIAEQKLKDTLTLKIEIIKEKTGYCRDWRNRWISHHDYDLKLNENARPLETADKKLVQESLEIITDFINILQNHFFKSTLYLKKISSNRGAFSLLNFLNDGLNERQNYFERLSSGKLKDYDINPKKI